MTEDFDQSAVWTVEQLSQEQRWVFRLEPKAADAVATSIMRVLDPERPLFDYKKEEFDFSPILDPLTKAVKEAYFGRGLALVQGLPRAGLSAEAFRLLNWAIGLHFGVARPQGKASQYISEVKSAGMTYRSAGGRGYNSNAKLDFHADGCDLVTLACYNKAKAGGQSMISSSAHSWKILQRERPDLAEIALQNFYFSRNQEQAPDEAPFYAQPLFDFKDGRVFGKWNRNRVRTAQELEGVPLLTAEQRECTDLLDEILRRPEVMFTMWMEPGDLQLMNNHVLLHSRTSFEDFDEPERQRLLYRLWLAPPDSVELPESWAPYFRSTKAGTVRGGIRGHCHDETCLTFERRQAQALAMPAPYYPAIG